MREWQTALLAVTLWGVLNTTAAKSVRVARSSNVGDGFLRGSVEQPPEYERELRADNATMTPLQEFGSKSLPLRAAVESIPEVEHPFSERRLPLRDAVERRPPPDEPADDVSLPQPAIVSPSGLLDWSLSQPPVPNRVGIDGRIDFGTQGNGVVQGLPNTPVSLPIAAFPPVLYDPLGTIGAPPLLYIPPPTLEDAAPLLYPAPQSSYTLYSPLHQYKQVLFIPPPSSRGLFQYENTQPHKATTSSSIDSRASGDSGAGRIVCYIDGAAAVEKPEPFSFQTEDLEPRLCTDLVYGYAYVDPVTYQLTPGDAQYDIVQGGYRSALGLKKLRPDLRVLLKLRLSSATPDVFLQSVSAFLKQHPFDGIDLELDHTSTDAPEKLIEIMRRLAEVVKTETGGVIAFSTPVDRMNLIGEIDSWELAAKMVDIVDYVTVKAFDFENETVAANTSLNIDKTVVWWLHRGMPAHKLVMGVPLQGRSSMIGEAKPTHNIPYYEICDTLSNGKAWRIGKRRTANGFVVTYATDGQRWIDYMDEDSLTSTVDYMNMQKLGGVAVISVNDDDFRGVCGSKWPLLTAINEKLKGGRSAPPADFCSGSPDGRYSDPSNCASYWECSGGAGRYLSCPSGALYHPQRAACVDLRGERADVPCRPGAAVFVPQQVRAAAANEAQEKPKVVCYVTSWSFYRKTGGGKFVPEHIDPQLCTHVVYAFASLDPQKLQIKEFDAWTDIDNSLYSRVTSMKGVRVLLSLGGWTDSTGDKYSRLVSDGGARRRFAVGTVAFLRKHGFQGLHLDWNYPVCWQSDCRKGPKTDRDNFVKLLKELHDEFSKQSPPMTLAVAISGYKEVIDVAYDLPSIARYVDFMSVMTYDYHGAWENVTGHVSPLYGQPGDRYPQYNVDYTMEYLVGKGAPRAKLLMGVPFYGQSFGGVTSSGGRGVGVAAKGPGEPGEFTRQPGVLAYYEVCQRIRRGGWKVARIKQGEGGSPYAFKQDQWVGYEDSKSVRDKARYVLNRGYGGAVAWTIDLDDFTNRCCGGAFPLLHALNQGLGLAGGSSTQEDCTPPPEPSTPAPPPSTTASDSGAASTTSTEHSHGEHKPTTTSPWWTTTTTKQSKPTTSSWWSTTKPSTNAKPSKQTTTSPWWTTTRTSTTEKPSKQTSTSPWWTTSSTESWSTTKKPSTTVSPTPTTTRPSSTTLPPPGVFQPEETPAAGGDNTDDGLSQLPSTCEPGQYLPDPYSCNAFYRCVRGQLRKQYCAGGLHWNRMRNVCDWPLQAKCTTANGKPSAGVTTKRPPSTTSSTTYSGWSHPPAASEAPPMNKCDPGAYYPHRDDCNRFYVCLGTMLVEQRCAPGLSYDAKKRRCDWSAAVNCQSGRKPIKNTLGDKLRPQPYSSCQGDAFAPVPGDCSRYMHCQWGKYEIRKCAPGLHWNNERKICDWPHSARCSEDTDTNELDEVDLDDAVTPSMTSTTTSTEPPTSTKVPAPSTTSITPAIETEWSPPSTTTPSAPPSTESSWEWHPPIPPTSEQPPLAEPLKPFSGYFKVVCYFTNWAWYRQGAGKYLPEDIDPNLCTHIVYGFAVLDYSNLVIKAHDSWADFDNQFYKRVVGYKSKGVKVSLAIGGWNDSQGDKYSRLVNNPAARKKFIEHVIKFLEKYGFDGLDLDWEYPKCWQVDCKKGPASDKPAFAAFVRELKAAFRPKGYLLSSAVSPSKTVIDAGYDVPALAESFDWIAVMTYDFHGQWDKKTGHVAPLFYHPEDEVAFFNSNFSINYWISEGVPRRKLIMGMPLYGQSFRLEKEENHGLNAPAPGPGEAGTYTRAAGFLAYYEICDNIKNKGWTVVQDPLGAMGPYAYKGNQWVSFDDRNMIRKKSEYIRKMDIGGGMIWALDLDDFKARCGEGRHPLLTIIRNVLADPGDGNQKPIDGPDYSLSEEGKKEKPEEEGEVTTTLAPTHTEETSQAVVDRESQFKVVCYFTNWAWYRQGTGKYLPSDIDPNLCTHIVYGFAVLDREKLVIKPHDSWADIDNKFYEKVTSLKSKGVKVLIAIGGWNDSQGDKYSRLVNDVSARRRFIEHVLRFVEENNFDGLDLDWEYPKCWQVDCNKGPASDKTAFADFLRELSEAFRPKGYLVSSAVSPSKRVIDAGYDVPALSRYLDWIAVMCYDYHGQWDKITGHVAPMYAHPEDIDNTFNTNFTIHYWIEKGAARSKLVLGMPMYGQSFSLAERDKHGLNAPSYGGGEAGEETRARGFLAYYEICDRVLRSGWRVVRDKQGRIGPYAYKGDQWVSFDDAGMIKHKSEWARAMQLGGAMIWALDLDDFKGNHCGCGEHPLLTTINRVLRGYRKPPPEGCKILGKDLPEKPSTTTSTAASTTVAASMKPRPSGPSTSAPSLPCDGRLFHAHPHNCNQYYLCNQGQLQLQSCPHGLYWNRDHCDWPENTSCHPDGTTTPDQRDVESVLDEYLPLKQDNSGTEKYKVICYYTNWAFYRHGDGKFTPSDIDPYLCTHIVYAFAELDEETLTIKPRDPQLDVDNGTYTLVTNLRRRPGGPKVLLSLGGWHDSGKGDKYSRLVADPEARKNFVEDTISKLTHWEFDGIDLAWEYPKCWQMNCSLGAPTDGYGFLNLTSELYARLHPMGLLVSAMVAAAPEVFLQAMAYSDKPYLLQNNLDWLTVMTLDYHGYWKGTTGHSAPLYQSDRKVQGGDVNSSISHWLQKGVSPSKLILAVPMYGQSFTLADPSDNGLNASTIGPGEAGEITGAKGLLSFYEICERVNKEGWRVVRDPEGRVDSYATHGDQWVTYDDVTDIQRKMNYVTEHKLGGAMLWALDMDDFRGRCGCKSGRYPLLKAARYTLQGNQVLTSSCA